MSRYNNTAELVYEIDLSSHELRRRTEILQALGPDWDPLAVLHGENQAYKRLYSGLDHEQQEIYERLALAGILPQGGGHDAA